MSEESFIKIEDYKNDIYRIIEEIEEKCIQLDLIYKRYIKQTEANSKFTMTLDTLFFRISMTKKATENYKDLFNFFIYHAYGQYYKTFIKIKEDYLENKEIFENIITLDFLPFDDINYAVYSFDEIVKIHDVIINVINNARVYTSKSKYEIEDDTVRANKGIGIDNLVFEKKHHNEILVNKIKLHNEMLNKLYQYQLKTLSRIMLKLKLLYFQIESDIEFESFNYSTRDFITETINGKLKNIKNKNIFEELFTEEFKYDKTPSKLSIILQFFSKFCIYT
tara:strand:- start:14612 stop:15448 length:837 start_codon:yes stop_codon:yes gene_type:complete